MPLLVAAVLLAGVFATAIVITPITFDTMHLADTLFIANGGWRVFNGLTPAVDYENFYGGIIDQIVATSFWLFGARIRALDYAMLLMFVVVATIAAAAVWQRLSPFGAAMLLAILATVGLTRAPLEEWTALTELVSAHSFFYNRFGLGLSLMAAVVALVPARRQATEVTGGLAAGLALALACLSKSSFAAMVPAVLLALALQSRWSVLVATAAGLVAGFLALDPLAQRFLNSASYIAGSVTATSDFSGLIFKAVRVVLSHPLPLTAAVAALAAVTFACENRRWLWLLAALGVFGALAAVSLSMGQFGLIGHQIVPICAIMAIAASERPGQGPGVVMAPARTIAAVLVVAFTAPHLLNTMAVTASALGRHDEVLIDSGPMAGYLHRYNSFRDLAGPGAPHDTLINAAAADVAARGEVVREAEYLVFVDGLRALEGLGDMSGRQIVSDNLISFEFAVGAKPAPSFPTWPGVTSPELVDPNLLINVDLVMILRYDGGSTTEFLRAQMSEDYVLCIVSAVWEVHARRNSDVRGCDG
jgi:hypothetical protein